MYEIETIRHSMAHVMAYAVKKLYKDVKFGIGPAIDNGFYYDFDFAKPIVESDLSDIKKEMLSILKKDTPFIRKEVTREEALKIFKEQNFKKELIEELSSDEIISIYELGDFVDLCRGPHVESTKDLPRNAHKLVSLAGAYWRGSEKNKMLQRIYAVSFATKEELKAHLTQLEEAKKRDHRKLGKELDLFSINEIVGQGLIHWHPKGGRIRSIIEDYWKKAHIKNGYDFVYTPHIGNAELWKISGHLKNFKEHMYAAMKIDDNDFYCKPMNCPFHIEIYKSKSRSYRELPLRWAEMGTVYRYEKSGTLYGLMRVRGFTQDDAHIICTKEQISNEIRKCVDFAIRMWKAFGFNDISAYLSTRPEKAVGSDKDWQKAINSIKDALDKENIEYKLDEGGGAFYGPKIDMKVKDAIGREWQVTTIQFDFNLPERFDMSFVGKDGEKHRPYMVHRALLGSLERFFGILIEHYEGKFPAWLSHEQARIIPVSEQETKYAEKLLNELTKNDLRASIDFSSGSLGNKIKQARLDRIPYYLVVGPKEASDEKVAVRKRDSEDVSDMTLKDCLDMLEKECKEPEF